MKNKILLVFLAIASLIMIYINYSFIWNEVIYPSLLMGERIDTDFKPYMLGVSNFLNNPSQLYYHPPELEMGWYLYPPPSVFLFLPYSIPAFETGQFLFIISGFIAFLASLFLFIKILKRRFNCFKTDMFTFFTLMFYSLAFAPLFQTLRVAQINTIVLFFCVLFLFYFQKDKYFKAGLILSIAFWLKIYPFLLALLFFRSKESFKYGLAGFLSGIVLIPLLFSPFLPLSVYFQYFSEYMPMFSNLPHTIAPMNQSFMSFLMMFRIEPAHYSDWIMLKYPDSVKILNYCFMVLITLPVFYFYIKKRIDYISSFSVLILIPVMSSLTGWEHTYVLAFPLLVLFFYGINIDSILKYAFVFVILIIFLVPKPPDSIISALSDKIAQPFQVIIYMRFLIASIASIVLIIFLLFNEKSLSKT